MIELDRVSVTYAGAGTPVLSDVDLSIPEGEMVLVMGRTGSGKSTLLRAINGLVPHFSGGTLAGPGTYLVRLTLGGQTATAAVTVLEDVWMVK